MNNTARLVAVTQPTILKESTQLPLTPDEFIAYCARVSNPGNQHNTSTSSKLVKYLIKNQHFSPFEMVHMVCEINTTRDISRQILRHRSFSFQEYSGRYSVMPDPILDREARLQDKKNRQNSIYTKDETLQKIFVEMQETVTNTAYSAYQQALDMGIAKEQARALLPEGLTRTTLLISGPVRSFYHYVSVRNHPATQKEHRDIAKDITNILIKQFPSLSDELEGMIEHNYRDGSNH